MRGSAPDKVQCTGQGARAARAVEGEFSPGVQCYKRKCFSILGRAKMDKESRLKFIGSRKQGIEEKQNTRTKYVDIVFLMFFIRKHPTSVSALNKCTVSHAMKSCLTTSMLLESRISHFAVKRFSRVWKPLRPHSKK